MMTDRPRKVLIVVNSAAFFISHRLAFARTARDRGYDVSVVTSEGPGVRAIRDENFDWHPLTIDHGRIRPMRDARTILELVSLYLRLRPDIVHHVTAKPVLYGTLAARLTGVPRVINAITGMGYLFTGRRAALRALGLAAYKTFLHHRDLRVVVQNREDLALFTTHRLTRPDALRTVRGVGVDLSRFSPAARRPAGPTVVQVSRMLGDKGVREFIAAARLVKQRHPGARFCLVGDTDPLNPTSLTEGELQEAVRSGAVEWLGLRHDPENVLRDATIYCLPSYREGLPKSLVEAAACALPLVATDTSGCREVVLDGVNGLLVPVGDAGALAAAIERLLDEPETARRMGERARQFAMDNFSSADLVDQMLQLYVEPPLARTNHL